MLNAVSISSIVAPRNEVPPAGALYIIPRVGHELVELIEVPNSS